MKIIVYGHNKCVYCESAKQLLTDLQFDYNYIDATNNTILKSQIVSDIAPGAVKFPVVIINGVWVGGHTELLLFVKSWKSDVDRLRKLLKLGETVTVVFFKINGEKRIMTCSTNMFAIPINKHPKALDASQTTKPKANPHLFKVFDLDKSEWRSFKAQSLLSVQ